eukprot:TRINITY_DN98514_c0_g1_i1.p1 TRINITY_DN98514_c0_g1~~TRINITY_DN98514_c0_g1_i1.p1  ORF type:complete len:118 (+),score=16.10 TRINITY_DN98514_c0_g1_i1:26-379(+)
MEANGGREFLEGIQPSVLGLTFAGNMLLQSRPLLVTRTGNALTARARLANAASLGSAGELILGPVVGQLSDRTGREPFLALFATAPVLAWLGVALSTHSPATRLRLLLLDMFLVRGF